MGHIAKNCPEEKREITKFEITCSNCKATGHYSKLPLIYVVY